METRGSINRIDLCSNVTGIHGIPVGPIIRTFLSNSILFLGIFILVSLFLTETSEAETWYVDSEADQGGNGTLEAPYGSILEGLIEATKGDTIQVSPGKYNETMRINKSITLVGSGTGDTIIDGEGAASIIRITADNVNISGFSVVNSSIPGAGVEMECRGSRLHDMNCSWNEYGIYVRRGYDNWISNVSCYGNTLAGILVDEGSLNNTIVGGQFKRNQRGVFLGGEGNAVIGVSCTLNFGDGCRVNNAYNTTLSDMECIQNVGNGCYLIGCYSIGFIGGTFSQNEMNGIAMKDCQSCSLDDHEITFNEFGIHLENTSRISVNNSHLSRNLVNMRFLEKSDHISVNNSYIGYSGDYGIWISSSHENSMIGNTIEKNRIGIFLDSASIWNTASYNNFLENTEFAVHCEFNNGLPISATENFWGNASGPFHIEKNPEGSGNKVSDFVEFEPWFFTQYFNGVDTGTLKGFIRTTKLLPISDASVTITCFNISRSVITDDDGYYAFSGLLRGTHDHYLIVTYPGYRTHKEKIMIQDNRILNITLVPVNKLPLVVVLTPGNGSEVKGFITIGGSVLDPDSENITVEMRFPDGIWIRIANESNWEFSLETRNYEDGELVVMFRAYDGENHSEITTHHLYIKNEDDDPGFKRPSTFSLIIGFLLIVMVLFVAVMIDHFIFGNRKEIYKALGIEKKHRGKSQKADVDRIIETVPIVPVEESFKPPGDSIQPSIGPDADKQGEIAGATRFRFYRGDEEEPQDRENAEMEEEEVSINDYDEDEFKGFRGNEEFDEYNGDKGTKGYETTELSKCIGRNKEKNWYDGNDHDGTNLLSLNDSEVIKKENGKETDNDSYKPPGVL